MASAAAFLLIVASTVFQAGLVLSQTNDPKIYTDKNPVPVGGSVTLYSTKRVSEGVWLFNNHIIVLILPGRSIVSNSWTSRVTFNSTTSSLSINSLTVSDSGVYLLDSINVFRVELTLSVQEPISRVTLTASTSSLVEFNDTAVFTCSVAEGSLPSYAWLSGSSKLAAGGNTRLSEGNTVLTVLNVSRHQQGPFKCNVSNGVSYEVSPPVLLNISYGPSNTVMRLEPMVLSYVYITESDITLTCSTESRPAALVAWMFDDDPLPPSGTQLQLKHVTESDSGNYTCQFYNPVTLRFSSASTSIVILEPVVAALLEHPSGPAIVNQSMTLYCNVSGTVGRVLWRRDGRVISTSNQTLIISPVQLSDGGVYRCEAVNAVSSASSGPYTVEVHYGPETPTITGPDVVDVEETVNLSCHASSFPPGSYTWRYNGSLVSDTSEYVDPTPSTEASGVYTCTAYNDITGLNSSAHLLLSVVERIKDVQLNAAFQPAVQGSPYSLTCSFRGPADRVDWMMNGRLLSGGVLTNDTLSFDPVEKEDAGSYRCVPMNNAGNASSAPYVLLVNFGPETPLIEGPAVAETGRPAVLGCSAASQPPSQISWWADDTLVGRGSVFRIDRLSLNMSGNYTCMAHNQMLDTNSTASFEIRVIEALESVAIESGTIPVHANNFTLRCNISGPYDTVYWMQGSRVLNASNVSTELHFSPVTVLDDDVYRCVATNVVTELQSQPYSLQVNYGPVEVTIDGPSSAALNRHVSLRCSADSHPVCDFKWLFSNSSVSWVPCGTGPVVTFRATHEKQGNYTCQAWNFETNITMYNSTEFTVRGRASSLHPAHAGPLVMCAWSLLVLWN